MPINPQQRDPRSRPRNLATFENAYAVAIQAQQASGADQFVIATGDPVQPFRVSRERPTGPERIQALVA